MAAITGGLEEQAMSKADFEAWSKRFEARVDETLAKMRRIVDDLEERKSKCQSLSTSP